MAAHDLRNPVSFIQQACKRLDKIEGNNQKIKPIIDMLLKNGNTMQQLLDDLLDISAIELGRLQLHKLSINLSDLVHERAFLFEEQAKEKSIGLEINTPSSTMVEADPSRISQVMDNLISNAIKYSPSGSTIRIFTEKTADNIRFNIVDMGPGISEQDQKNLFKTFQRLGHKTTGGESSHGLGLAICLRIINAHLGDIQYQDAKPTGSHFYFELPR